MAAHRILPSIRTSFICGNRNDRLSSFNPFFSISNQIQKIPQLSASISPPGSCILSSPSGDCESHVRRDAENIHSWMRESVPDIVKNLKKAPLLVQIYAENDERMVRIKTEEAISWPFLKCEWEKDGFKSPDVLIFVEELEKSGDFEDRVWGIVVQGKGMDEKVPKCYLLKTNTICGGFGLGFCTHFCLMRAINFRDSAFEQFKNHWLLQ